MKEHVFLVPKIITTLGIDLRQKQVCKWQLMGFSVYSCHKLQLVNCHGLC